MIKHDHTLYLILICTCFHLIITFISHEDTPFENTCRLSTGLYLKVKFTKSYIPFKCPLESIRHLWSFLFLVMYVYHILINSHRWVAILRDNNDWYILKCQCISDVLFTSDSNFPHLRILVLFIFTYLS